MKIGSLVRGGLSWASPVWIVLALNVEKLAERLGLDTALAHAAAPEGAPAPVLEFLTQPWILSLSLIILGVTVGVWIDAGLRAIDAKRENKHWWKKMKSFSIERASCLMAGVMPNDYANSEKAKGIADELIGLVRAGDIPTNMEPSIYGDDVLDNVDFPDGTKFYKDKPSAGRDAVISRREVELFARRYGHELPWHARNST